MNEKKNILKQMRSFGLDTRRENDIKNFPLRSQKDLNGGGGGFSSFSAASIETGFF